MSNRFTDLLQTGHVILMDGAMGTELLRAGAKPDECLAAWNLTQPEKVRAVHRSYVIAGARCLLTNTFQSNPVALAKCGLEDRLEEINQAAIDLARSVYGIGHFVIGDIGPIFSASRPGFDPKEYLRALIRVIGSLRMADALLFETWPDLFSAAVIDRACRECLGAADLPVLISFAYQPGVLRQSPYLGDGIAPGYAVRGVRRGFQQLALVGVNCGRDIDLDAIIRIIREYRTETELPLLARPNAGTPTRRGDEWVYPLSPRMLAQRLPELLEAGVQLIGGCCGTTPEHIAAMRPVVDEWNKKRTKPPSGP